MKRLLDIIVALSLLVLLLPLFVVVASAIKLDSKGPVLFRQQRIGRDGQLFSILKFRSMVQNAAEIGSYRTADRDPRITPLGQLLRRSSIDELPQLFNVLLGEMSLVGPRPDVPAQRADYTDAEWLARHRVRPGITGLAQATLRSSATPAERKALDISYAEHPSIYTDLWIILMTIKQVVLKGGN